MHKPKINDVVVITSSLKCDYNGEIGIINNIHKLKDKNKFMYSIQLSEKSTVIFGRLCFEIIDNLYNSPKDINNKSINPNSLVIIHNKELIGNLSLKNLFLILKNSK